MRKPLRLLGVGALALALLLPLSGVAGKWWLEHRFLKKEIRLGAGTLRVYGGAVSWTLRVHCDSVWYRSPALRARVGNAEIRLFLLGHLRPLAPVAEASIDTAFLHLSAQPPDTAKASNKTLDSLVFPDLKLPVRVALKLRAITVENDSGILASAWDVNVRNPSSQKAEVDIGTVRSPAVRNLRASFSARADWSSRDSVDLALEAKRETDRVTLTTRRLRARLLRGRGALQAQARDSRVYTRALGLEKNKSPFALDARLDASVLQDDSLRAQLLFTSRVQGFSDSMPLKLSPQQLDVRFDWRNDRGQWSVKSHGKTGELLTMEGNVRKTDLPEWDSLPPLRRFAVSARGKAEKFRVHANGKIVPAEARLENADWNGQELSLRLTTGDSSRVRIQARQTGENWSGDFALHVSPRERWVTAFVDTNVSFAALDASGTLRGKTLSASLAARDLRAYGARLDSLSSRHLYGPNGYVLQSARLAAGEDVWLLSGRMGNSKPAPTLNFHLESARHGGLDFLQDRDHTLHVKARHFEVGALPYEGLAKLPIKKPAVDGSFDWNPKRRTGAADVQVLAAYQKEDLQLKIKGHWDRRELNAEGVELQFKGSALTARGRLRLNGRQFYDLGKLKLPDYEYVSLETPGFDLARADSLVQPEPALKSGKMRGGLTYAGTGGFNGSLSFTEIAPCAELADVVLKSLRLDGRGDTLAVTGITRSENNPLLNDSLSVAVTHALGDTQSIRIEAVAADSLRLRLDAVSGRFNALRGRLQIQGKATLPEESGLLDKLHVDVDFFFPLRDFPRGAALTSRAFEGDYILSPRIREHFSLLPVLNDGVLSVPDFLLTAQGQKGQPLQGNLEYGLASKKMSADFHGGEVALQWTDNRQFDVKMLAIHCSADSNSMEVHGGFSEGSIVFVQPPLHAEGSLRNVNFSFNRPPPRADGGAEIPRLQFSGALSRSLIRYRLKSFSALQDIFRKERGKKRSGGRNSRMQLDVNLRTLGDSNRVDSDILRLSWAGNMEMHGVYPYTLVQGRINALKGELFPAQWDPKLGIHVT